MSLFLFEIMTLGYRLFKRPGNVKEFLQKVESLGNKEVIIEPYAELWADRMWGYGTDAYSGPCYKLYATMRNKLGNAKVRISLNRYLIGAGYIHNYRIYPYPQATHEDLERVARETLRELTQKQSNYLSEKGLSVSVEETRVEWQGNSLKEQYKRREIGKKELDAEFQKIRN